MGPWVRSSDIPLRSLVGPPALMQRAAARQRESGAARGDSATKRLLQGAEASPPLVTDARVAAYRLYVMKHCIIMTPIVYVLILNRAALAARMHDMPSDSLHAVRSLSLLYRGSWGLLLSGALALALWTVRRPDLLRKTLPSDAALTCIVVFDCVLSALNASAMLEYVGRRDRECPRAASVADCLLRVRHGP